MDHFAQNFSALMQTDLSRSDSPPLTEPAYRSFLGLSSSVQSSHWNLSASGHPRFIFASIGPGEDDYLQVTNCTTGTTYVDVQVSCMSKGTAGKANCGVDAVRKSLERTEPPGAGFLEALRVDNRSIASEYNEFVARGFLAAFTDIMDDNQIGSGQSSIIQKYLYNPMAAFDNLDVMERVDLGSLDVKLVERRLSLLYNTLWKVSWSYRSMTGGNMTTWYDQAMVVKPTTYTVNVTSHTVKPLEPTYALDVPWLIVYFVSVGVMFFAAVASLLFHAKCHAPPLLGYVSSMVRDSVFFSDSSIQGNSTEGGASKTGRLRSMEVKVADVWSEESVGRVAFAPAQAKGVVKKERWYD